MVDENGNGVQSRIGGLEANMRTVIKSVEDISKSSQDDRDEIKKSLSDINTLLAVHISKDESYYEKTVKIEHDQEQLSGRVKTLEDDETKAKYWMLGIGSGGVFGGAGLLELIRNYFHWSGK